MLTNYWIWQSASIAQEEEPSVPQKANVLKILARTYKSFIRTMKARFTPSLRSEMDVNLTNSQKAALSEPTKSEENHSNQIIIKEGQVISISGDKIYINLGAANGIQKGMLLRVYRDVTLTNAATSEEITQKQGVGKVLLIDVQEDLSEAFASRFELKKDMEIQVGDMVSIEPGKVKLQQGQTIQPTTNVARKGYAYIVSVNGGKLYLDIVNGIRVGTEITIVKKAPQVKHPVTGKRLKMGADKKVRGKLAELKEKMSVIQLLSPEEITNFQRGDLIKIVRDASDR